MQNTTRLNIPILVEPVADAVRDMIVDGRLPPGQRIKEVHLAATLGVSRTPLREALNRLTAEGALTSVPHQGFHVCALTVEELEQLYPIRALLDPEALRLTGLPPPDRLKRLKALNEQIGATREPEAVLALDDLWHLELVADCPNAVLLGLIRQFIRRTRRYELALMRERPSVQRAVEDHRHILDALRRGHLDAACDALRRNLHSGKDTIVEWLRQHGPPRGGH